MKKAILCLLVLPVSLSASAQNKEGQDEKFFHDAVIGSMAEVVLGKIAQTNGVSIQVKKFGKTMVDDHSRANGETHEQTKVDP